MKPVLADPADPFELPHRPRRALTLLALLVSFAGPAAPLEAQRQPAGGPNFGERSTFELEVRRWSADLISEIRLSQGGIAGTTLDPAADLNLPEGRGLDYRISIRVLRRLKLRGGFVSFDYEGEAAPSSPIAVAGLPVEAGQTVTSLLEFEQTRVGAEFDLLRGVYAYLAVVGEFVRLETRTEFEAGGVTARGGEPERMDLPLFGLKGRVYLTPAMALTLEAVGMKREATGVMTELEASATYNLMPNLAISYGYRNSYNRFKELEASGDRAVFRLRGQYVGVTVRF